MKSVMQHDFSRVPKVEIPRSVFNRSHGYKTTFDADQLVPFYLDEALPGDTFTLNATIFARLATPVVPIMDNLYLDTFYFAVPYRLVWDHWVNLMGEKVNPDDDIEYLVPQVAMGSTHHFSTGDLGDYFGLPVNINNLSISSLPFRAYQLIFNEWFRDQNLQDSVVIPKGDGPEAYDSPVLQIRKRNKRHDYFTSALPWPQKGPDVNVPIGSEAPVIGTGSLGFSTNSSTTTFSAYQIEDTFMLADLIGNSELPDTGTYDRTNFGTGQKRVLGISPNGDTSGLIADLSEARSATINELREAYQVQRMYERDARSGSRYTEVIRAHFNIVSPDARLQRPEYLGGTSKRININPVQQTSSTPTEEGVEGTTPQGNLAAYGQIADTGGGFTKSFTEHTLIIGLVNVRSDLTYSQGINRMWKRRERLDFYWPALAHLGEQEVLRSEIYANGVPTDDNIIFGYQERFAEYRYYPSQITGLFRPDVGNNLSVWHLSEKFDNPPELNETFIQSSVPLDRVIAVPDEPHLLFDSHIELRCARPMPVYGVPGLVDHF